MGKKRKVPSVNASSSADIAFILLLFFLLTTSMDTDKGLPRQLPRPIEKEKKEEQKVNQRNVLQVRINSENQILCAGEVVTLAELKNKAKEFIDNPTNAENLPEKIEVNITLLGGAQWITEQHLISLQCDRGTNYQVYVDVQNELAAAYNELRNALSIRYFNSRFSELDAEKQEAVKVYYNQKISEAEPKNYGENSGR